MIHVQDDSVAKAGELNCCTKNYLTASVRVLFDAVHQIFHSSISHEELSPTVKLKTRQMSRLLDSWI